MPTGVYGFQKIAVGDDDEPHLNVISFLAGDLGNGGAFSALTSRKIECSPDSLTVSLHTCAHTVASHGVETLSLLCCSAAEGAPIQ